MGTGRRFTPPEKTGKPGRPSKDNRTMLNGMVWIARSGAPGVTSRNAMAPGIRCTAASASGLMMGSLIISSGCSALRPNYMNFHWMPLSSRPTSTVLGQKKGASKRDRAQPGRCQLQNPCSGRRIWLSCISDA